MLIDKLNNLLLIILVILVIFCIAFYIYNGFDIKLESILYNENFDNILENKTYLLELMNIAKQNANKILKEKFIADTNSIFKSDAINYNNSLNELQTWLDNSYYGDNGILAQIQSNLRTAENIRTVDKQALLDLLTNMYIINYINYINRQNAESYKMYLKYNNPKNNKYYTQYLK
jgi:hypothetical protein